MQICYTRVRTDRETDRETERDKQTDSERSLNLGFSGTDLNLRCAWKQKQCLHEAVNISGPICTKSKFSKRRTTPNPDVLFTSPALVPRARVVKRLKTAIYLCLFLDWEIPLF